MMTGFAGILKRDYAAAELQVAASDAEAPGHLATVGLLGLAGLEWLRRRKNAIARDGPCQ
jgi:MYXO-CTERM domain-containing protein